MRMKKLIRFFIPHEELDLTKINFGELFEKGIINSLWKRDNRYTIVLPEF
jgi:hypothetical protein